MQSQEINQEVMKEIENYISSNDVVLFMKGTKEMPMCGFSSAVVNILQNIGAEFITVDVMSNNDIRQGIKQYTNWPTIPQLYVRGQFIGGCDIVKEMYENGDLVAVINGQ